MRTKIPTELEQRLRRDATEWLHAAPSPDLHRRIMGAVEDRVNTAPAADPARPPLRRLLWGSACALLIAGAFLLPLRNRTPGVGPAADKPALRMARLPGTLARPLTRLSSRVATTYASSAQAVGDAAAQYAKGGELPREMEGLQQDLRSAIGFVTRCAGAENYSGL